MIAAVDVHYGDAAVVAACVLFADWLDATAARELVATHAGAPEPYEPGAFFRRELPYVRAILAGVAARAIVVDGYAWLGVGRPGLGVHVFDATGVPVIGVAKRRFAGADTVEILRGTSKQPLHVTAIGCDVREAAASIQAMHGPHRIPTLLKRVDQLCRGLVDPV